MRNFYTIKVNDQTAASATVHWESAGRYEICNVRTEPEFRRRGMISALLRVICDAADKQHALLFLTAKPEEGNITATALELMYNKLGFQWTATGSKMERKPQSKYLPGVILPPIHSISLPHPQQAVRLQHQQ